MKKRAIFEDAFNLLCGDKLNDGTTRDVYACRLKPDLVVKVETTGPWRTFSNAKEMHFWDQHQHYKPVADWLAPCHYLSPDGFILLQSRVDILRKPVTPDDKLPPAKLPFFITDRKYSNFGWLNGRLVCVDYAGTVERPSVRLTNADYWE